MRRDDAEGGRGGASGRSDGDGGRDDQDDFGADSYGVDFQVEEAQGPASIERLRLALTEALRLAVEAQRCSD